MAWVTSGLYDKLSKDDVTKLILDGFTILGDCAFIKQPLMTVPLKGSQSGWRDGYQFHQSQLRITIERALGVLVHRWACLRSPLGIPLTKVAALVMCLCRLHTYCIDSGEGKFAAVDDAHWKNLQGAVQLCKKEEKTTATVIALSEKSGRPSGLLNHGQHFRDAPKYRPEGKDTPYGPLAPPCQGEGISAPQAKDYAV